MILIYGLVTGLLFGILLQKGDVLKYDRQIGALQFKDMTIFKFMLTAIVVACIGLYLLNDLSMISFKVKSFSWGAQIVGGLIFGIGWGILGYCPGTATGAIGEGRVDALVGFLGMLFGGAIYGFIYTIFKPIISFGKLGKIRIPEVLNVNHWIVITVFTISVIFIFWFFEKKRL